MLERDGWILRRIRGSHHVYTKPGERRTIPVPVHGHKALKRGIMLSILRDAGLES